MNKNFIGFIILIFSVLNIANAEPGGWVASGGELFQFQKNPWFVKNTTRVSYCIQIDSSTVSASSSEIESAIQNAFDYWKKELNLPKGGSGKSGVADIGTQEFVKEACEKNAKGEYKNDVRFLIGYGALSKEEVLFLKDPLKYVGVTVRTDYINESLKAKGFVFIASDKGDHAYSNPGHLVSNAWSEIKLLQYALIHEVGHIMGIPHTGSALMSEVFLDQLLHKRFSKFYLENPVQSFLNPPLVFEICGASMNGSFNSDFFKLDPSTSCLRLEGQRTQQGGTEIQWNIYSRLKKDANLVPAGVIKGSLLLDNILGAKPAIIVHLPSEQQVFNIDDRILNNFMVGPIYIEGSAKGNFIGTTSARPYELTIELRNDSITMTGLLNNKIQNVLVYSPPNLIKMLYPIQIGP